MPLVFEGCADDEGPIGFNTRASLRMETTSVQIESRMQLWADYTTFMGRIDVHDQKLPDGMIMAKCDGLSGCYLG